LGSVTTLQSTDTTQAKQQVCQTSNSTSKTPRATAAVARKRNSEKQVQRSARRGYAHAALQAIITQQKLRKSNKEPKRPAANAKSTDAANAKSTDAAKSNQAQQRATINRRKRWSTILHERLDF
jgi:hypothetical protein